MKRFLLVALSSAAGLAAFASPTFDQGHVRLVHVPAAPLHPVIQAANFLLDAPATAEAGKELKLWATYYHMPTVRISEEKAPATGGAPLLGKNGKAISPTLSVRDWCDAAMQGSIRVDRGDGGEPTGYMFVDADGPEQMNCDAHFGQLSDSIKSATQHARFVAFHHPQGCDVRPIPLMAFRTIAVDPEKIPMGTVLFVPGLRGQGFWKDGELYTHDGYVVAADRGGAITGNHIDLFVSDAAAAPFPEVVASSERSTFKAYVVPRTSPAAQALQASQKEICKGVRGPGRRALSAPDRT